MNIQEQWRKSEIESSRMLGIDSGHAFAPRNNVALIVGVMGAAFIGVPLITLIATGLVGNAIDLYYRRREHAARAVAP